jgi:hypothetical protein
MMRLFLILLFISECCFLGCTRYNTEQHLKYLGQVGFRKSYAGHQNWSEAELDSVEKSNPYFMDAYDSSSRKIIDILAKLEIANTEQLLLDKIDEDLKDTIVLSDPGKGNDTAFIKYDTSMSLRTSIILRNKKILDSLPIERGSLPDVFRLINLNDRSNRFVILLNQYYIMNGYNYEISVYERT